MGKFKRLLSSLLIIIASMLIIQVNMGSEAQAGTWDDATDFYSAYEDGLVFHIDNGVGKLYTASRGNLSTSGTRYHTVAWRFTITDTSTGTNYYVYYAFHDSTKYYTEIVENLGGYEYELFIIEIDNLLSRMPSAAKKAIYNNKATIKADAMMTTRINGTLSGTMTNTGAITGTVYTTYDGIAEAAGWSSTVKEALKTYFDKDLTSKLVYKNKIYHWVYGFNSETGTIANNPNYYALGSTYFSQLAGSKFTLTEDDATTAPNGFEVRDYLGSSDISGDWDYYDLGYKVTQKESQMEFYYFYDPIQYDITYVLNGGTNNSKNVKNYNVLYGVTLYNPTRTGYTFSKWTNASGIAVTGINKGCNAEFTSASNLHSSLKSRTTGDQTLTANWIANSYTIKYNGNGSTSGSTASSSHTYDVAKTLTANGFVRSNYTFNGWNTKADGTGTSYTNQQSVTNLTAVAGGTVTLYAQWTINKYYLDINNLVDGEDVLDVSTLNIGSFDLYLYDGVLKFEGIGDHWAEYEYGATYEIKNIKAMTGYTYLGPSSYSGTIGTSDTEIWLEWKTNEYTLTFNGNGGTPSKTSQKIKYKEHCINLATANREGYEFQGWNTKADGTGETITGKTVMGTSDITVYAQWKPNVYINTLAHWLWGFENGEGNNGYHHETDGDIGFNAAFLMREDSFETAYNTSFEMTKDLAITPPNGTYLLNEFGTYKTNEFSTELDWVVYPFGTKFTQKDKIMHFEYDYAPVDYKITYDLDGGTNHNSNPSTYNVLYGVTLQNPTKAGYTFNGWYDSNGNKVTGINEGCKAEFNSTNELFDELAKRATGDIHLTAKWIINSCTATFDANGGTTPSPQTITKNYN